MAMSRYSETIELCKTLIQKKSVTPLDEGCQSLIANRLQNLGFEITPLRYGDVDNLWAVLGDEGPLFCFAGHTDVVPTGAETDWHSPPFDPVIDNDRLVGRGAADMKGSLAAMLTACERFLAHCPKPAFRIAWLITSDEEGIAVNGTVKVVEWLQQQSTKIDWCLVGEPSSTHRVGDIIKNGRRGSLGATLKILGKQGHVAYPHLANNPIHCFAPAITELCETQWDQGNDHFPATSLQISNISAGTGATNVIPGTLDLHFNIRFSTEQTAEGLKTGVQNILDKHAEISGFNYEISWQLSGNPFLTEQGTLVEAVKNAIELTTGQPTELSTAGGTSDGRFIAKMGAQIVELGPVNESIHQVNEWVSVSELDTLSAIYEATLEQLNSEQLSHIS